MLATSLSLNAHSNHIEAGLDENFKNGSAKEAQAGTGPDPHDIIAVHRVYLETLNPERS